MAVAAKSLHTAHMTSEQTQIDGHHTTSIWFAEASKRNAWGLDVTALLSRSLNGDTARHGRHGRYRARGPISSLLAQLPCFFSVLQRSCTVLSARRDGPPGQA